MGVLARREITDKQIAPALKLIATIFIQL